MSRKGPGYTWDISAVDSTVGLSVIYIARQNLVDQNGTSRLCMQVSQPTTYAYLTCKLLSYWWYCRWNFQR